MKDWGICANGAPNLDDNLLSKKFKRIKIFIKINFGL